VKWTCTGDPEYTLEAIEKEGRGTDIILHISEDSEEYLQKQRIGGLLEKYCKFLPVEIQFGTRTEYSEVPEGSEEEPVGTEVANIINNPKPAWKKQPNELTDEDYLNFYNELHPGSEPPLFWVHLNIDYPFNLTGILYFPKLGNQMEMQRNKIHLYSNQVFVTDEVKEIVPEFLTLLHGIIDSPDIPLNVSRSYLQSDRNVKKITEYITKKVADKLDDMFRKERSKFEEKWENINVFVKYGYVTEEKFAAKAKKFVLLENVEGLYYSIEDYKNEIKATQTDKDGRLVVLYTNNKQEHDSYIASAKEAGYDVLFMETVIDVHFVQALERTFADEKLTFVRVDSDTIDNLIPKDEQRESVLSEDDQKQVEEIFTNCVNQAGATVKLEALSPNDLPIMITRPEFMRRMREASQMQGMDMNSMPDYHNVVINTNHEAISMILGNKDEDKAKYLYNLARLHQGMLTGVELTAFVKRAVDFIK